jgi:transketolase
MREAFGKSLVSLGETLDDLVVLDPDVSASTRTCLFAERFPDRFFNMGISEQDLVGTAAGLAIAGKIPVATGFAVFLVGRGWEQIRNTVARQSLNVKIVATHAGLSDYGDGASHQSIADVALMRVLPNMTVVVPADDASVDMALGASVALDSPVYVRLSRAITPKIYEKTGDYALGKATVLREGSDATIIANGVMVSMALAAASELAHEGLDVRVLDMSTVKPLDVESVAKAAFETGAIVTAEEHSVIGGLGGAVSEFLAESRPTPMRRIGISDRFGCSSRTYGELLESFGLTPTAIADGVRTLMRNRA